MLWIKPTTHPFPDIPVVSLAVHYQFPDPSLVTPVTFTTLHQSKPHNKPISTVLNDYTSYSLSLLNSYRRPKNQTEVEKQENLEFSSGPSWNQDLSVIFRSLPPLFSVSVLLLWTLKSTVFSEPQVLVHFIKIFSYFWFCPLSILVCKVSSQLYLPNIWILLCELTISSFVLVLSQNKTCVS